MKQRRAEMAATLPAEWPNDPQDSRNFGWSLS